MCAAAQGTEGANSGGDPPGNSPDGAAVGSLLVAVDLVGAAVGDRVLVVLGDIAATMADASVDASNREE